MIRGLRRIAFIALLGVLACNLEAQNPDDLSFGLRLGEDPPEYHIGEPISFEISLSSSSEHKYYASPTTLMPGLNGIRITVRQMDGVIDLGETPRSFAGSAPGPAGYLNTKPAVETGDLTYWYRFDKPGHFRVSIALDGVSRIKTGDESGGEEAIPVQSNAVEFDILPPDPACEQEELQLILNRLDHAADFEDRIRAAHRLSLLQTATAAAEEVRRFLEGTDRECGFYYNALAGSSLLNQIIPALEAGLTNPAIDPPEGIVELLTTLQVRKQIGNPHASIKQATKLHDLFLAKYSKTLLDTIRTRSGPQQLNAEFEAWSDAERLYAAIQPPPEALNELRADLLNAAEELSPEQASRFLVSSWYTLPHADLLALVRRVAVPPGPGLWARDWAFKFWCEDWPSDCQEAILRDVSKPHSDLSLGTILLIPEAEHPELDARFEEQLADPNPLGGDPRAAALISRTGSRNIRAAVDAFLDEQAANLFRNRDIDGYLLAYLLRISPKDATRRLAAALTDRTDYYGYSIFRALNHSEDFRSVIPLAIAALNNPNLNTTRAAALFLAEHGAESARAAISQRLNELRAQWHDQGAGVRSAMVPGPQLQAAQFEETLASALAHARGWTLSTEERDSLAKGCFTDQCRQTAQGKGWEQF